MTEIKEEEMEDPSEYIIFSLLDEKFGISVLKAKEILFLSEFTKVPKASSFMVGVINLRGVVLPVIDLKVKLGLSEVSEENLSIDKHRRIVVIEVEHNGEMLNVGSIVDSVSEVIHIPEKNIDNNLKRIGTSIDNEFVKGVARNSESDKFTIILNTDKVFSLEELDTISENNVKAEDDK